MLLACSLLVTSGFSARAQVAPTPASLPSAAPTSSAVRVDWRDHPTLYIGPSTRVEGRLRIQADVHGGDATGDDEPGGVDVARRRIGLRGVILGVVEFEVERELRREQPWRDVFVNVAARRDLQVQAGQFKLPFGLDENASSTNLNFVTRTLLSTHLTPGRDRGIVVHGRLAQRVVRYEAGLFDHDGRNARTDNPERVFGARTAVARIRAAPLARATSRPARLAEDLHVGLAFTRSAVPEGVPAVRGRTVLEAPFFPSRFYVDGTRLRTGVEFRWRPGPFSVEAEYVRLTTARRGEGVEDQDLSPLVATAWYIAGTWALTGERKTRGLDTPRRPFLQGGAGAIELAVRTEALGFRSRASGEPPSTSPRAEVIRGNRDHATTVGANWYLNRWIKLQANIVRERLDDAELGPRPPWRVFWSRLLRAQVTL